MSDYLRKHKSLLFKAAISSSLLLILIAFIDLSAVVERIVKLDSLFLLLALLIYLVSQFIACFKWFLLNKDIPYTTCLRFIFVGNYYSMILPGQVSGEIAKAWRLGRGKRNAELIAASVFIDRLTGLIGLLILATVGVANSDQPNLSMIEGPLMFAVAILCLSLFIVAIPKVKLIGLRTLKIIMSSVRILERQYPKAERLIDFLHQYARTPGKLLISVCLGIVFQLILVALTLSLARALEIDVAFFDICWILGAVSILIFLPITVSGIGVREAGFVGMMGIVGITSESAFSLSLLLFSLQILGAITGGLLEFIHSD